MADDVDKERGAAAGTMGDGGDAAATPRRPRGRSAKPENDAAMGAALRHVYQQAVEERVPDEFLDLLGKLD